MVTAKRRKTLLIITAVAAGGCLIYSRLNPDERRKFRKSLKRNSALFLLNVIPYAIDKMRKPPETVEVPGPTPYATVEI